MKQIFFLFLTILLFASCQGQQSKAIKDQQKAYEVLKNLPGGAIATAEGSWTMTAKIDGKTWQATYLYPPETSNRISGYKGDEMIGLPYKKQDMVVGKKETFSESHATDLFINDDVGIYGGRKGEMVITKVNGNWVEGTFYFTANTKSTTKTVEVTDGFFRFKIAK